jgi:hypothetical protein
MGAQLDVIISPKSGPEVTLVGTIDKFYGVTVAPEPASLLIFGVLGVGLLVTRRANA